MIRFTIWMALWLVCAVAAYLLVRRDQRRSSASWTQMDRLYWLSICLLYGPVTLAMVIIIGLAMKLGNTRWGKREAQW